MYKITHIGTLPLLDCDLDCEIFKSEPSEHPYRVRLVDRNTGEVGPQIRMFKTLLHAAHVFDKKEIIW